MFRPVAHIGPCWLPQNNMGYQWNKPTSRLAASTAKSLCFRCSTYPALPLRGFASGLQIFLNLSFIPVPVSDTRKPMCWLGWKARRGRRNDEQKKRRCHPDREFQRPRIKTTTKFDWPHSSIGTNPSFLGWHTAVYNGQRPFNHGRRSWQIETVGEQSPRHAVAFLFVWRLFKPHGHFAPEIRMGAA